MILPKNLNEYASSADIDLTKENSSVDFIEIQVDETDKVRMYNSDTERKEDKYNQSIEKIIRSSNEYRRYIGILKNEFDLTRCKFIDIVDITDGKRVGIEMHHYPLTLYDIVECHRDKLARDPNGSPLDPYKTFEIANDIMKLHYQGKIGLVPLSFTAHELVHEGVIFIPLNKDYVFGDYESLIEELDINSDQLNHKLENTRVMTEKIDSGEVINDLHVFDSIETRIMMEKANRPEKIFVSGEDQQMA